MNILTKTLIPRIEEKDNVKSTNSWGLIAMTNRHIYGSALEPQVRVNFRHMRIWMYFEDNEMVFYDGYPSVILMVKVMFG